MDADGRGRKKKKRKWDTFGEKEKRVFEKSWVKRLSRKRTESVGKNSKGL